MLKNFIKIFTLFLVTFCFASFVNAQINMRNYQSISLAKGSYLKAVSLREISSATAKAGESVYFINPENVYIGESNVIPKNSVFVGVIESITEAVEGINAAMKIKIVEVKTTKDSAIKMDAYVYWKGTTTIGGDLTQPEFYKRMPHYTTSMPKGVLQLVPTSIRFMGQPVAIRTGEEVTFVMNKDIPLYSK